MGQIKKIGFGFEFSYGLLFGVRHYEPDEICKYYEIQIFLGPIIIAITIG
tara:strand:- start:262 stop:411 length:150 start_codon:yes stop_codon:yes gene_type:complete